MEELTPMLRQYLEIKEKYKDAILFFRMGDFYEMFFDDAKTASQILDIALTSRNKLKGEDIPMAGIPHFSAESYITRLVDAGHKVAVCDQVEDARKAKGIVKREVTKVITPGVVIDAENLDARTNNWLFGINRKKKGYGIAYLDVSTGDFFVAEPGDLAALRTEIARIEPRELVLPAHLELDEELAPLLGQLKCLKNYVDNSLFEVGTAKTLLQDQFEVASLAAFGCEELSVGLGAAGALLHYLQETRPGAPVQLDRLIPYVPTDHLVLDESTTRNLELVRSMHEGKKSGSLLHLLDLSVTPMGARTLRRYLIYPLMDPLRINARLDRVEALYQASSLRAAIREKLSGVADIERLNTKIGTRSANARDLVALRHSLEALPALVKLIESAGIPCLASYHDLDRGEDIADLIARAIVDDPPIHLRDGGIIRKGFDPELDELARLSREGKGDIARMEAAERERTGIASLKIRYNKVFGYYLEVTRANLKSVPEHYIRKQTLTSCERFITPELKEFESKVLGAEERRIELEQQRFTEIREQLGQHYHRLKEIAGRLASLDALCSLAEVAARYNYVRPHVDASNVLDISEGRHPVVERMMKSERFVPNDVRLDTEDAQMMIITGPNMAGKSTIMRQVALIVLMAQMGAFVPAKSARIGVVDRIFTRVGASDNLSKGQSTFMVEMTETAHILHFATRRSLVILDEIGRGTSTFDGLSIAWAVAEDLHDRIGARVMFATHYHELTELELTRERVRNFTIAVAEWGERIVFLRKLKEGGASRSYGIQVARLAGLPRPVVERAREILGNLERGEFNELGEPRIGKEKKRTRRPSNQLSLFSFRPSPAVKALLALDTNALTPMQALEELARLQRLAEET